MRAALLPAVGAPLELVERDDPLPGPGEARVRIEACDRPAMAETQVSGDGDAELG